MNSRTRRAWVTAASKATDDNGTRTDGEGAPTRAETDAGGTQFVARPMR
jgi:hypothetical protein